MFVPCRHEDVPISGSQDIVRSAPMVADFPPSRTDNVCLFQPYEWHGLR